MTLGSSPPPTSTPESAPAAEGQLTLKTGLSRGLRWALWGAGIGATLFLLLVLFTRFVFWPQAAQAKSWLESTASRSLGRTVAIRQFETYWEGWHPAFRATDISIRDAQGNLGLHIAQAEGSIAWESVGRLGLYFHRLVADQTHLQLKRDAKGVLWVATMAMSAQKGDGSLEDWLLNQDQVVLSNTQIDWSDAQPVAPNLGLTRPITASLNLPTLSMQNDGVQHDLEASVQIAGVTAAPVKVSSQFQHSFLHRPSTVAHWNGQLHWDIPEAQLSAAQALFPVVEKVSSGSLQSEGTLFFAHGQMTAAQTAFSLKEAQLKVGKAIAPLQVYALRGVLQHKLEADKHQVTVDKLEWQATKGGANANTQTLKQLSVAWAPAAELSSFEGLPKLLELRSPQLDLGALNQLAQTLPLPIKILQQLQAFQPRGRLENVQLSWEPAEARKSKDPKAQEIYSAAMHLQNVSIDAQAARADAKKPAIGIPGFNNLSGKLEAKQSGGSLQLDSLQGALTFPGIFEVPRLPFESLKGELKWQQTNGQWVVTTDRLTFSNPDVSASAKVRYQTGGKGIGLLDMDGVIAQAQIKQVPRYLPVSLPASVRQYLAGALLGGVAKDAKVSLHGDLEDFPFANAKNNNGIFKVEVPVHQAVYRPAPPLANQAWPNFENIEGQVNFDRTGLAFKMQSATAVGARLSNVQGNIENMAAVNAALKLEGEAQGESQAFIRFLNESPVGNWIGKFTQETRTQGNGKLALKLELPLQNAVDTKVSGSYQFQDNAVQLMEALPPFSHLNGQLQFSEKGVQLPGISGQFLGGTVRTEGGSQPDGSIKILARGTATVEGFKEAYAKSALERIGMRLAGATPYQATIRIHQGRPEVTVQTDLQGLAIDLPYPMQKAGDMSMPTQVTWRVLAPAAGPVSALKAARSAASNAPLPDPNGHLPIEEILVQYGTVLGARYEQRRNPSNESGQARVTVLRGGLGINQPIPLPDAGVLANIALDQLDIDAWRLALNQIAGKQAEKQAEKLAEKQTEKPAEKSSTPTDTTATPAVAQSETALLVSSYLPTQIAAQAKSLKVVGRTVRDVVAGASRDGQDWQANVDSPQISGYLRWRPQGVDIPFGELTAKLARLTVPNREDVEIFASVLEDKAQEIPSIDITAEEFNLGGRPLGRLEAKARSISQGNGPEWELENMSLKNPGGTLNATGNWKVRRMLGSDTNKEQLEDSKRTSLNFHIDIEDAGILLDTLGMPKTLSHGEGKFAGRVDWLGSPMQLDYKTLSGHLELVLNKGQFLKVEPGVAKLLGVLSFQGLGNLATFDLRGLFGEGTPFNTIVATGDIEKGIASTEDFVMVSAQATVLMRGSADIPKETQNLHVTILPNVNAATASIALAVVNPAIGLGTLVAQYLLKDQISQALKIQYDIDGAWANPNIIKK